MNNIDYILSPLAIRERCHEIYKFVQRGESHFKLHEDKTSACANYVLEVIYENYPDLNIPFHSRWRHFKRPLNYFKNLSQIDKIKEKWNLVIPSVLLDAGAGMAWKYFDKEQNKYFSKSEGLAPLVLRVEIIFCSSPISTILTSADNSLRASIAPAVVASGAKSPPITSNAIFI